MLVKNIPIIKGVKGDDKVNCEKITF